MKRWRILIAESENYSGRASEILNAVGDSRKSQMDRQELLASLTDVEVLIVRLANQIDEQVISSAPCLKVIVSATTGLDHIDLAAAEKHGVKVLSLRGEYDFLRSIPATAELTWALLLALTRRVPAAFNSVLKGQWIRDQFKGHDLSGRNLGVLGMGRIGHIVARYGLAFGMRVIAYDPAPVTCENGVERVESMPELLTKTDVLSIHVPLNTQTVHLVGKQELDYLSPGAMLINTSRGDVVDEIALLQALEQGKLAGAALDVLSNERTEALRASPLINYAQSHDNLILTPHIGGATYESMAATEIFMAEKLVQYLKTLEDNG